jgi:hypothetical protein
MKPKLTFLLSLTFLFLFSDSVYAEEPYIKESKLETFHDKARGLWACKDIYNNFIKNGKDISEKMLGKEDSGLTFMKIKGDTISFSDKSGEWYPPHEISWDMFELYTNSKEFYFNFNFKHNEFLQLRVNNFRHPEIYSRMGTCERIENLFKYLSPN